MIRYEQCNVPKISFFRVIFPKLYSDKSFKNDISKIIQELCFSNRNYVKYKKLSENVSNQQLVTRSLQILSVTKVNSERISVRQTEKQM